MIFCSYCCLGNFTNIPKTIASRYQLQSFGHWSKSENEICRASRTNESATTFKGTTYRTGMAICSKISDNGQPDLYVIKSIRPPLTLICIPTDAHFEPHLRSYKLTNNYDTPLEFDISKLKNLPMDIFSVGQDQYLSQRSALV